MNPLFYCNSPSYHDKRGENVIFTFFNQQDDESNFLLSPHIKDPEEGGTSSMTAASFNFINSIIGSGLIDYSIILLIKGGNLSGTHSYQSLVHSTFGFAGFVILSMLQFLYPFIVCLFFVQVSLVSMLLTVAIIIVVVIRAATLGTQIPPSEDAWVFARWNAIQAVGVMSFAFICHHNSFIIYESLQEPTLKKWSRITHVSVGSAALISAVFAAAGYATFTGYTQGDIFENYCKDDNLATFGRFCYGLSIITTFPLECFVTREVVSNVFFNGLLSNSAHVMVTVVIISAVTAISLSYDCLGVVLELNGVLSATPLIFIIPSACFLKLNNGPWYQRKKLLPSLILITGVFVMIIGLVMTALFPQDCSHGAEMFYCSDINSSVTTTTPHPSALQTTNTTQNITLS
uniref:Putative sodium-coupled neutral amino acid transporter 11 n=1 Tax=Astyanax mexicanus TaxID=7994 RepID=W5KSW7_ASTMX